MSQVDIYFPADPSDLLSTTEDGPLPAQKPLKRETSRARLKKQSSSEAGLCAIGGRDSSLFLFRALGKILYCKSEPVSEIVCHTI